MSLSGRNASTLADVYTPKYWRSRWHRVAVPFLIAFGVSSLIALAGYLTQPGYHVNLGGFTFFGQLPAGGPGNYFFTVLIQFVLFGPAIWVVYHKSPTGTLIGSSCLTVAFELWANRSGVVLAHPYVHAALIPRFALALVLGMWLADGWALGSRRNTLVLAGAAASVVYLTLNFITGWTIPWVVFDAPTMNFGSFFYAAFLVMIGMRLLPESPLGSPSLTLLAQVGRDSYHTFLVQILWFSSLATTTTAFASRVLASPPNSIAVTTVTCVLNLSICLAGGAAFARALDTRKPESLTGG